MAIGAGQRTFTTVITGERPPPDQYWSYCCPDARCCPPEGSALALPGTSVMAAAAAYAGIQVRGSLREMEGRLAPLNNPPAADQEKALDTAGATLVPRILDEHGREQVAAETLALARRLMKRIAESPRSGGWAETDVADDRLIAHDEAAAVILGIQDRDTRDRAAEWMEGPDAGPALRLWRALARRCVGPYCEHAAAPLTLAGWVAWSTGDEPAARVALGRALRVDPDYVFARLLHEACNQGLDPETVRSCLRAAGSSRASSGSGGPDEGAGVEGGRGDDGQRKARSRPRPRRLRPPMRKKALPPAGTRPAKSAPADGARGSRRSGERGTRSGR